MPESSCQITELFQCAYKWQTLITGVLAIFAAWPVWQQLKATETQSAAAVRDVIYERTENIERQRNKISKELDKVTVDFLRRILPHDDDGEPDINIHWAHEADQIAYAVFTNLTILKDKKLTAASSEIALAAVIRSVNELHTCLTSIHAPLSFDFSGPDYDYTEEQIKKIIEEGEVAKTEIVGKIYNLNKKTKSLDDALKAEIALGRLRLHKLDAALVEGGREDLNPLFKFLVFISGYICGYFGYNFLSY
jgi:hypothetical protein